jgi:hypothetical protein
MPVTGSSFAFSWPIVHDGVIRRSEDEFSEVIWRGMSPAVCMLIFVGSQFEFEFDVQNVRERVECRSSGGFGFGGMTQFQVPPTRRKSSSMHECQKVQGNRWEYWILVR